METRACKSEETFWEKPYPENWYRFSIKPLFRYRKEDRYNTSRYYFHWLGLNIWTIDSVGFSFEIGIEDAVTFKIKVPYLISSISIPILSVFFLQRFWRKPNGMGARI